jgi:hypothetical protein
MERVSHAVWDGRLAGPQPMRDRGYQLLCAIGGKA